MSSKQTKIVLNMFGWVFCLFRFNRNIETLCFGIEAKQPKLTVSKQTKKTRKNEKNRKNPNFSVKNSKICSLSNCFCWYSVCFGSIETSKLFVSVLKRNNQNKRFVSDSAETSFCSSFGCFESKLVKTKDTLGESAELTRGGGGGVML